MKRRAALSAVVLAAAGGLAACAGPQVSDYAAEKPVLDLRSYFNGKVDAWGIFTDRQGKVVKRFTVDMTCTWQGEQGVLDESFVYSDGTQERRIWKLTHLGNGQSHSFGGTFLELQPNERIRHNDRFDDPQLPGEMVTQITFKTVLVGTEVHIEQTGIPDVIPAEACCLGWQESLQLLALLVEADIPT